MRLRLYFMIDPTVIASVKGPPTLCSSIEFSRLRELTTLDLHKVCQYEMRFPLLPDEGIAAVDSTHSPAWKILSLQ